MNAIDLIKFRNLINKTNVKASVTGNFSIGASDFNTKRPVTGTNVITIPTGLSQNFAFIHIARLAAGSTTLSYAGVTLVGVGGTLDPITTDGSAFLILPSGTTNKFYVHRIV